MSATARQAAIRELMRAASNALDVCGNEALGDDPRLASRILMFAQDRARARLVVDLAAPLPTIVGEMVREVGEADGERRIERLELFALHAAPSDEEGLH